MKIKNIITVFMALLPLLGIAKGDWVVKNVNMTRNGEYLVVEFDMDFANLGVEPSRAILFTPILKNGSLEENLNSIGVYGRNRYYHYLRRDGNMLSDASEIVFKNADKPEIYHFKQFVPYTEEMNGSKLEILARQYGCCHKMLAKSELPIGVYEEIGPVKVMPAYLRVQGTGVKERDLSGEAWVQFVVDRTDIRPELFNNPVELGKITASIDSVKADPDITITGVWLKGFASPESPYTHNADLARGRVNAVSNYIQNLYKFAPGIITTDYEPEDWAGLRKYVENSNINHREEILAMIDSNIEPDAKESKIKITYPAEYNFLLKYAYPPLRHTEYKISYRVRNYSDVNEIKRVLETAPQNLNQDEFYLLASSYDPGTTEFNDVFETCVRMFPNDPTANLNAAMAALESNDTMRADKYLAKAGNSIEAVYARGMSALIKGQYSQARALLQQCVDAGMTQAIDGMKQLEKRDN